MTAISGITRERASVVRYIGECRRHWRSVLLIAGCMAALALLQLPGPIVTMRLIDRATAGSLSGASVSVACMGLAILLASTAAVRAVQSYALELFKFRLLLRLQRRLFAHSLRLPLDAHSRYSHGYLLSRINDDPQQLQNLFAGSILSMIADACTLCVGLGFLFHLHFKLALLAISALPVMIYLFVSVRTGLKQNYSRLQESSALVTRSLADGLSNIITTKAFLLERTLERHYFCDMSNMWRTRFTIWRRRYSYETVISAITGAVPIGVLWYGIGEVTNHRLTIGQLVAFLGFLAYLYRPAEGMVISLLSMQSSISAADRIFEILDLRSEAQMQIAVANGTSQPPPRSPVPGGEPVADIVIRDLSIRYPGASQCALSHVTVEIQRGESVHVAGPSGAGKSTLAKALTGFLPSSAGAVWIQGEELARIPIDKLRERVLLVTHEPGILSGSILANIMCGAKGRAAEDAIEAARLAHAHDFISRLPRGYETDISKDGARLSSGQIQRIVLARALLRKPAVLILDEAMSFLDQNTATEILAGIRLVMRGKTLINICHRAYGVLPSDRQLLIQHGSLFERDRSGAAIAEPVLVSSGSYNTASGAHSTA